MSPEPPQGLREALADALYPPIWARAVRGALDGDQC
jgi:hypothetical protein